MPKEESGEKMLPEDVLVNESEIELVASVVASGGSRNELVCGYRWKT